MKTLVKKKRGKRTLSGRFRGASFGATLQLHARWSEDPERLLQVTVFEVDIPKLKSAIAEFERGNNHEAPPLDPVPTNADGRKTFKKIGDHRYASEG